LDLECPPRPMLLTDSPLGIIWRWCEHQELGPNGTACSQKETVGLQLLPISLSIPSHKVSSFASPCFPA
jgi:hypothetical protein